MLCQKIKMCRYTYFRANEEALHGAFDSRGSALNQSIVMMKKLIAEAKFNSIVRYFRPLLVIRTFRADWRCELAERAGRDYTTVIADRSPNWRSWD